jgi:hypothetical protein
MACIATSHIYSTTITNTTIAVTWETSPTAISYQVEYQVKPTYPAPLGTWIPLVAQTTVGANIGNLISGTTYLIRVNCICETGECYSVTIEVSTN